jgi:mono/diheme cytochrome c family protein
MRYLFAYLTVLVFFGFGCANHSLTIIGEEQLPSQSFHIQTNRDTILHTAKGAILKIPSGAFSGSDTITLAIKEAYSMSDIVKGGLLTVSDTASLSSGGMIYIHPAYGGDQPLNKPITVSIPVKDYNPEMSIYKGETQSDGSIKWTDPKPLTSKVQKDSSLSRGKQLFMDNCSSCHAVDRTLTGPPLAFIAERRDRKWLYDYTRNYSEVILKGDPYANCLRKSGFGLMTTFTDLTDQEMHDLYAYISDESKHLDPANYPDFKKSVDSCRTYTALKAKLSTQLSTLEAKYSQPDLKIEREVPVINDPLGGDTTIYMLNPDNLVKPVVAYSDYYTFNIKATGWYNVDICTQDIPGLKPSNLTVKINGSFKEPIHVFIAFPSHKTFTEGGLVKGSSKEYGFYTDDGHINLPIGNQAYVFVLAQGEKRILWASQTFNCATSQTIELNPAEISKEGLYKAFESLNMTDLSLKVKKVPHADEMARVKSKLSDIEKLKPRSCDCNCYADEPTSDTLWSPK